MPDLPGSPGASGPSIMHKRIAGLDSIRFLSASVVVLDHYGVINFAGKPLFGFGRLIWGIFACLFNGPAAVIIFFIISGFCIHYPFRRAARIGLLEYFSRRLLRVGLPAVIFVVYMRGVLGDHSALQQTVLWSIICELIYYLLYPALISAQRQIGWLWLIIIAYITSLVLAFSHLVALRAGYNGYSALGVWLTWIIGLPCWLGGCYLAESFHAFKLISARQIWALRSFIFLTSIGLRILKFHVSSPLASNCITLNLFAFLAFYWLGYEIIYLSQHGIQKGLEWCGRWSYSIYLAHPLVYPTIILLGWGTLAARSWFTHFLTIILVYIVAYAFFLLIERPSHTLAIKISKLLRGRTEWQLEIPAVQAE